MQHRLRQLQLRMHTATLREDGTTAQTYSVQCRCRTDRNTGRNEMSLPQVLHLHVPNAASLNLTSDPYRYHRKAPARCSANPICRAQDDGSCQETANLRFLQAHPSPAQSGSRSSPPSCLATHGGWKKYGEDQGHCRTAGQGRMASAPACGEDAMETNGRNASEAGGAWEG